jgi:hypothetical protein
VAALLNCTIVNALALCITERAKDRHYRYFGRTIARIPLPRLMPADAAWPRLARCARRAAAGENVAGELDRVTASLYGLTTEELERMAAFVARRLGLVADD